MLNQFSIFIFIFMLYSCQDGYSVKYGAGTSSNPPHLNLGVTTTYSGTALVSGSTDGAASAALYFGVEGITFDPSGNLYVVDGSNHTIRKISGADIVSTFAGIAGLRNMVNGTGNVARFDNPGGIVADSVGDLYVADSANNRIRKITPAGVVTTFAGSGLTGSLDGTGVGA